MRVSGILARDSMNICLDRVHDTGFPLFPGQRRKAYWLFDHLKRHSHHATFLQGEDRPHAEISYEIAERIFGQVGVHVGNRDRDWWGTPQRKITAAKIFRKGLAIEAVTCHHPFEYELLTVSCDHLCLSFYCHATYE